MATQSLLYSSLTAFTLTGTSLASFAARQSTVVANSTNLYIDMVLSGFVTVGAAVATGNCHLLVGSFDGTTYSYPLTGTDAAVTLPGTATASLEQLVPGQLVPGTGLIYAAKIPTAGVAAATAVGFGDVYVAQLFNGNIPLGGIGLVLINCQGQAFDATAGHTVLNYVGLKYTIA